MRLARHGKCSLLVMCSVVLALFVVSLGISAASQYDFGGETVRISLRMHGVTPLGPRRAFDWYEPDPRLQAHIEQVEDMFNVKVEFVMPRSEGEVPDAIRQGVLAGEAPFDMAHLFTGPGAIPALAMEGFIYPLDDVLEASYWDLLPPELDPMRSGFQVAGRTFAFPAHSKYWDGPTGFLWNKTLFEQDGLPNPYELYAAGEWTWEAFQEICRLATRDTSGDGNIDQWGARLGSSYNWIAVNEGQLSTFEDGRFVLTLDDERNLAAWAFLHDLVQEGIANWGYPVRQVAMFEIYIHELANWTTGGNAIVDDYEWGIVPYPRGPHAADHISPEWGWVWGGIIPINTTHDPRALIELMNALQENTLPYIDDLNAWQDAYWSDRINSVFDMETLEVWRWADENTVLFPDPLVRQVLNEVGWGSNKGGAVANRIIDDGTAAAAVMSEIQPQAQAILDELLEQ